MTKHFLGSTTLAIAAVLVSAGVSAPPAQAQFGGLNAEFAGGGARALSMGGAFIGLADDATATEFNPAGLWQLRTPEFAIQGIYTEDRRDVARLERSFEEERAIIEEDVDHYFVPSFVSFVYPFQPVTVGVSEFTNIYFRRAYRDSPESGLIEENASNYALGLTLARGITRDFSVGITLRENIFQYSSDDGYPDGEEDFESIQPSANVGFIWRIHPMLRLGGVYKSPQRVQGDYRGLEIDTELPDTAGLGLAFLPDKRWRILVDVDYIQWSRFDPNENDDFRKEDVWRYHTGTEWFAGRWKGTGLFLRGGYMYEESNAFRYGGGNPITADLVPSPDPVHHITGGIGLARRGFQIDLGADVSEEAGFDLIASAVLYF